ncbi:ubiquitin conjugating [Colletotrichum plurivorum]|uniref:Ubiquitin conjugating n=1 Tax=Colletotrichum plurivorum TaxID=2175906 RepID=A0A8H6KLF0_9PEZI|nr:ubiquitin conjugating [Colletotrichum plurivorum]
MSLAAVNITHGNGTHGGQEPGSGLSTGGILTGLILMVPLVILPLIFVRYTLNSLYLAIVIIEEEDDPHSDDVWDDSAEHFSDNPLEEVQREPSSGFTDISDVEAQPDEGMLRPSKPTASLRSIAKQLRESFGLLASFRGFFSFSMAVSFHIIAKIAYSLSTRTPGYDGKLGFSPSLASDITVGLPALAVSLAAVQVTTHWVHVIITAPTPWGPSRIIPHLGYLGSLKLLFRGWLTIPYLAIEVVALFRKSLPPFGETFHATALPVTLHWIAANAASWIDVKIRSLLYTTQFESITNPKQVWGAAMALFISYASYLVLVVPTQVVLFRIQASLLPQGARPIIPFQRAFERFVEPRSFGGTGYLSMSDAWRSFSRPSWRRVVRVYFKIACVNAAFFFLIPVVLKVVFLVMSLGKEHKSGT